MTVWLREWLLRVIAAAFAVSLAQAVTPPGTVKKIGGLIGGLVLLLTAVGPLLRTDLPAGVPAWREVLSQTEMWVEQYTDVYETFIAEQIDAYLQEEGGA